MVVGSGLMWAALPRGQQQAPGSPGSQPALLLLVEVLCQRLWPAAWLPRLLSGQCKGGEGGGGKLSVLDDELSSNCVTWVFTPLQLQPSSCGQKASASLSPWSSSTTTTTEEGGPMTAEEFMQVFKVCGIHGLEGSRLAF